MLQIKDQKDESSSSGHIIYPSEAEAFVKELSLFKISDIGSERWSRHRERLEQLALQAIYNVSQQRDEFVKDLLVTHEKLGVLVHELLSVELWRENVFPLMLASSARPTSGLPAYLVLYTEGTLVSLLETSLFYEECCESVGECVLDLVDYCHRQLVSLLAEGEKGNERGRVLEEEEEDSESDEEEEKDRNKIMKELKEQSAVIRFSIKMRVLSLFQYITDHISMFALTVSSRLLNNHDLPCLLVHVMELKPWERSTEQGGLECYEDGHWCRQEDRMKLVKTEGQVWLTFYHILLDKDCQQKYEFTSHKKQILLRLRKYLTSPLLEQLPHLEHLQRYLEHLALMDPPPAKRDLILQQVPVIYEQLHSNNAGHWQTIANLHSKLLLEPTPSQLQEIAKRWMTTAHLDVMEELVSGPPRCAACGGVATKRCSRCRNEWYCGRRCQVGQWSKHKPACDVIASN